MKHRCRRFLQCIRRYRDTRNIFPHLVNCGKYTASILAGVFLSVYRLNNTRSNMAIFVAFSTVNGIYTGKPTNTSLRHNLGWPAVKSSRRFEFHPDPTQGEHIRDIY